MTRRLSLAALTAILFAFSSVAPAQRTGSRLGRDASAKDGPAAMELMASCAVNRRPDLIRQWFQYLPGTPEEAALLRGWATDLTACLDSDQLVMDGKELRFKPRSMRLPVAMVLARKAVKDGPLSSPIPDSAEPWFVLKLNALGSDAQVDRDALLLQDFGHCVAVRRWGGSRALLLSRPDSIEQKAAVSELAPVLGACLAENAKITLTPANLRSVLAEPMYQIIAASTVSAASKR